eukprot:354208-Chlamydomonas_euryale.AAC.6
MTASTTIWCVVSRPLCDRRYWYTRYATNDAMHTHSPISAYTCSPAATSSCVGSVDTLKGGERACGVDALSRVWNGMLG